VTGAHAEIAQLLAHLADLRGSGELEEWEFVRLTTALLANVGGDPSAAPPPARWEYQEFTKPIGGASGPPTFGTSASVVRLRDAPPHADMYPAIERAVRELLNEAGVQGWVPAEATDVLSLWVNRRVECDLREPAASRWLGMGEDKWTLRSVRLSFRRPAQ
jgi:hypothetical protein